MDERKFLLFVKALEKIGGIFVKHDKEKNMVMFDIPEGSRIDRPNTLKNASRQLKAIINSNTRLAVRRLPIERPKVAYEDEINGMLRKLMNNHAFATEDEFISCRDEVFKRSGASMKKISDLLADGLILGMSIDMQLDRVMKELKLDE
jgi:threonyl-tRNA synthetase